MVFHYVGKIDEFPELRPKILEIDGKEIAVYRWNDKFFAYQNRCPHQGGPACEGIVQGDLECEMDEFKHITKKYFSTEKYNIICPWHAVEYDLGTGIARGTKCGENKLALKRYETIIENGQVKVKL